MRALYTLLTLALTLGTGFADAQDTVDPQASQAPEYRVEILVFANREFDGTEEVFDHGREAPEADDLRSVSLPPAASARLSLQGLEPPPAPSPEALGAVTEAPQWPAAPLPAPEPGVIRRLLAPEELELGNAYRTLDRLGAYAPLLHGGWVQAGLPQSQTVPFALDRFGRASLRGEIELYLSRFLHVELDLSYQPESMIAAPAGLGQFELPRRYALRTERRVRSGELHYFDHPAFGVLLVVKPMPQAPAVPGTAPPAA